MIHSGSRHLGKEICDHYHKKESKLNDIWYSQVSDQFRLAFLPIKSTEGKESIDWMNLALEYAYENRERMMEAVVGIVSRWSEKLMDQTLEFNMAIMTKIYGFTEMAQPEPKMGRAYSRKGVMLDLTKDSTSIKRTTTWHF